MGQQDSILLVDCQVTGPGQVSLETFHLSGKINHAVPGGYQQIGLDQTGAGHGDPAVFAGGQSDRTVFGLHSHAAQVQVASGIKADGASVRGGQPPACVGQRSASVDDGDIAAGFHRQVLGVYAVIGGHGDGKGTTGGDVDLAGAFTLFSPADYPGKRIGSGGIAMEDDLVISQQTDSGGTDISRGVDGNDTIVLNRGVFGGGLRQQRGNPGDVSGVLHPAVRQELHVIDIHQVESQDQGPAAFDNQGDGGDGSSYGAVREHELPAEAVLDVLVGPDETVAADVLRGPEDNAAGCTSRSRLDGFSRHRFGDLDGALSAYQFHGGGGLDVGYPQVVFSRYGYRARGSPRLVDSQTRILFNQSVVLAQSDISAGALGAQGVGGQLQLDDVILGRHGQHIGHHVHVRIVKSRFVNLPAGGDGDVAYGGYPVCGSLAQFSHLARRGQVRPGFYQLQADVAAGSQRDGTFG